MICVEEEGATGLQRCVRYGCESWPRIRHAIIIHGLESLAANGTNSSGMMCTRRRVALLDCRDACARVSRGPVSSIIQVFVRVLHEE